MCYTCTALGTSMFVLSSHVHSQVYAHIRYILDMRSFFSQKVNWKSLCHRDHFTNKNVRDKSEKWETFFFQRWKIMNRQQISTPKSSMGTLFVLGSSKKRSIFAFECRITPIWVPRQHHLTLQHFGGHVA